MHINYKQDEFSLKNIIKKHTTPIDQNKKNQIIYYKKFKTANLIFKNNKTEEKKKKSKLENRRHLKNTSRKCAVF